MGRRTTFDFNKLPARMRARADRLVRAHAGLARRAINITMRRNPSLDHDEVESAVLWTLMRCAVGFNEKLGWRFSTYAYRSLLTAGRQSAAIQMDRRKGKRKRSICTRSYDAIRQGRNDDDRAYDFASPALSPLAAILEAEARAMSAAWVREVVADLPPREQLILIQRVIEEKTLEEVGRLCDPPLTKERVRQLEGKIFDKVLRRLRARFKDDEGAGHGA